MQGFKRSTKSFVIASVNGNPSETTSPIAQALIHKRNELNRLVSTVTLCSSRPSALSLLVPEVKVFGIKDSSDDVVT